MEEVSKEIFLRRFFMDEAIKDIAEKLEISVSAVSNRILRGRKKLEVLFREEVI
ncbi:RNA polymerase factor sigma-70 [compost metagenome]